MTTSNQDMSQKFGAWLRVNRDKSRLSLAALADKVGTSKQYLSILERGKPSAPGRNPNIPSRDVVKKLAEALNAPVEEALDAAGYSQETDQHEILQGVIVTFQSHANLTPEQRDRIIQSAHLIALGIRSEQLSEWLEKAPPRTLPLSPTP